MVCPILNRSPVSEELTVATSAGYKKWCRFGCNFKLPFQKQSVLCRRPESGKDVRSFGGIMAINVVWVRDGSDDFVRFQPMERLSVFCSGQLYCSHRLGWERR